MGEEALVGAHEDARAIGQAPQAVGEEALRPGHRRRVTVAQLDAEPLAGLGDEAERRMPADPAGIGAARALARTGRAVRLDVARVDVERDPV